MSLSSEEVFEVLIALLILAVAVVMVKITNIASPSTSLPNQFNIGAKLYKDSFQSGFWDTFWMDPKSKPSQPHHINHNKPQPPQLKPTTLAIFGTFEFFFTQHQS